MSKIFLEQSMRAYLHRYAQSAEKKFQPKYTHPIRLQIADINLAITELNSAKTLIPPEQSAAVGCINKIISYFTWLRTVGLGGNVSAVGKDELIPSREEFLNLVRTGLFGPDFIISLASILKLNEAIPQINNEFAKLK